MAESSSSIDQAATESTPQSVRDLRRRWKPQKQRLDTLQSSHPTAVRMHRAFSWLARVEQVTAADEMDLAQVRTGEAIIVGTIGVPHGNSIWGLDRQILWSYWL